MFFEFFYILFSGYYRFLNFAVLSRSAENKKGGTSQAGTTFCV